MKKKGKIAKKTKKTTELVDASLVDDVISDIASNSKDKRLDKFILFWLFGLNVSQAGIKAGYSRSYATGGIGKRLKSSKTVREKIEKFAEQAPNRYRQVCQMRLATIANIEGKGLKLMEDDPKLAIDKPQFLKQLKQSAGVLADDAAGVVSVPLSTIIQIRNMQLNLLQAKQGPALVEGNPVMDAELE